MWGRIKAIRRVRFALTVITKGKIARFQSEELTWHCSTEMIGRIANILEKPATDGNSQRNALAFSAR
jgi:hypothetical protein